MSKFFTYILGLLFFSLITPTLAALTKEQKLLVEIYRSGQNNWPKPMIDKNVHYQPLAAIEKKPPENKLNPTTDAKISLGKQLFFDRRLSKSKQIACASCHDPDLGWADGKRVSIGHDRQQGNINAPTIVNSGWLTHLFWDGRVNSLEKQVIASWINPIEMAADVEVVVQDLKKTLSYPLMFRNAFGSSEITPEFVAQAIASFMRSMNLTSTAFDRFMRGQDDALSDREILGLHLFRTKARCANCHHGSQFSDGKFHHLGTSFHNVGDYLGRFTVTGNADDVGAFRTPSLRGAISTKPFMHNGLVRDLDVLLRFYNMGWWQNEDLPIKNDNVPTARLSPLIQPLGLSDSEIKDIILFINSLNGPMPIFELPKDLP